MLSPLVDGRVEEPGRAPKGHLHGYPSCHCLEQPLYRYRILGNVFTSSGWEECADALHTLIERLRNRVSSIDVEELEDFDYAD